MRKYVLMAILSLLAIPSLRAQNHLSVGPLFRGELVTMENCVLSDVTGKKLKPYNLDVFRSVRFAASEEEIIQVGSLILSDSRKFNVGSKNIEFNKDLMVYALISFEADNEKNEYLGYQLKSVDGKYYVTLVFLKGDATADDLRVIFKKR